MHLLYILNKLQAEAKKDSHSYWTEIKTKLWSKVFMQNIQRPKHWISSQSECSSEGDKAESRPFFVEVISDSEDAETAKQLISEQIC